MNSKKKCLQNTALSLEIGSLIGTKRSSGPSPVERLTIEPWFRVKRCVCTLSIQEQNRAKFAIQQLAHRVFESSQFALTSGSCWFGLQTLEEVAVFEFTIDY